MLYLLKLWQVCQLLETTGKNALEQVCLIAKG
jgi:hypothetical protein